MSLVAGLVQAVSSRGRHSLVRALSAVQVTGPALLSAMAPAGVSAAASSSLAPGPFPSVEPTTSPPLTSAEAPITTTAYTVGKSSNIKWHDSNVTPDERFRLLGQRGCVVWFTGLSGSGKSTLAYTLDHALLERGKLSFVLDGDNVRHGLNKNLGFSAKDREENIRRIGEVAKLFADAGVVTLVSFISPYLKDRANARALLQDGDFVEVYMKIPLSVCEARDPKGLYKAARAGKLKGFTGIDDPYEEPENPEITIEVAKEDGNLAPPALMAAQLLEFLEKRGIFSPSAAPPAS